MGKRRLIMHLDVRPVIESHECVVDYVFKTILRGRVSYDDGVLLLPRIRDELMTRRGSGFDPLRDPVLLGKNLTVGTGFPGQKSDPPNSYRIWSRARSLLAYA